LGSYCCELLSLGDTVGLMELLSSLRFNLGIWVALGIVELLLWSCFIIGIHFWNLGVTFIIVDLLLNWVANFGILESNLVIEVSILEFYHWELLKLWSYN
jgi:hypothetical protein